MLRSRCPESFFASCAELCLRHLFLHAGLLCIGRSNLDSLTLRGMPAALDAALPCAPTRSDQPWAPAHWPSYVTTSFLVLGPSQCLVGQTKDATRRSKNRRKRG